MSYRIQECRSCHAGVIWTVTEAGKPMPVDAAPVPNGNVELSQHGSEVRSAVVAFADSTRTDLHTSHFATCKQAKSWRK